MLVGVFIPFSTLDATEEEGEDETNVDDNKTHTQEPIYVNINAKKLTNPIEIKDLHNFIQKGKANDHHIIKREHGVCLHQ